MRRCRSSPAPFRAQFVRPVECRTYALSDGTCRSSVIAVEFGWWAVVQLADTGLTKIIPAETDSDGSGGSKLAGSNPARSPYSKVTEAAKMTST